MIPTVLAKWHFVAAAFFTVLAFSGIFYKLINEPETHNVGDEIMIDEEDCDETVYW